jgi:hypothetical protein
MRRFVLALAFLTLSLPFLQAQKTRFGQEPPKAKAGVAYPIRVHISGIHRRTECGGERNCWDSVYADAEADGIKIELSGYWIWTLHTVSPPLGLGDYQARILKDTPNKSPMGREYELVFPDRRIWRCAVTGIFE